MSEESNEWVDALPKSTDVRHKFSVRLQLARLLWSFVQSFCFMPFSMRIFRKWRVLVLRCFRAKVDWTCTVHSSVRIWAPWNLAMGPYSCLGPEVDCYNQGFVSIGANAVVSQKTYICASSHDYADPRNSLILCPVTVCARAWVAADAFLGPGVTVGEGAVVGARSVVVRDMPAWTVCGGHPCKPLKPRVMRL